MLDVYLTHLQLAMLLFLNAAAIPAANKPPNAPESIAPQKNTPSLVPSSLRVYHPENRKDTPAKNGALDNVSDLHTHKYAILTQ